mgnify:FL=1|tara:strand:- start:98 stop:478 length:381 start_codon:yes stop_codon:yes gene_type:complete
MLYVNEILGASFCLFSVILGAFASHYLKKVIPDSGIQSFEVGVRYLMYHGLVLMIIPQFYLDVNPLVFHFFIAGTCIFSSSIFLLSIKSLIKINLNWLGPLTPIGGGILIIAWIFLLIELIDPFLN